MLKPVSFLTQVTLNEPQPSVVRSTGGFSFRQLGRRQRDQQDAPSTRPRQDSQAAEPATGPEGVLAQLFGRTDGEGLAVVIVLMLRRIVSAIAASWPRRD